MSKYQLPSQVNELAAALGSLPGIGPKLANRLSIFLATSDRNEAERLQSSLGILASEIGVCPKTGNITENSNVDPLFEDSSRVRTKLLVVESPLDLIQIESSGAYDGLYLVMGGLVAPLRGISPNDLNFDLLTDLLKSEPIEEVILAFSSTVEGEATSLYTLNQINSQNSEIKVTRLARGLPTGAAIEFLDFDTINSALDRRVDIE